MRRRVLAVLAAALLLTAARAESVSPTTGLTLSGAPVTPVLLPIGNNVNAVKTGGRQRKAAGVGKGQPWGAQLADIVYESLLYTGRSGCSTRMTFLFHDALANGVRVDAGPMRSVRETQVLLSREWRAMLVYSGRTGANASGAPGLDSLAQPHFGLTDSTRRRKRFFDLVQNQGARKHKGPDCFSARVTDIAALEANRPFQGQGFCFGEADASLPQAAEIALDWGDPAYASTFRYEAGRYLCFHAGLPYESYLGLTGEEKTQLAFDNLIIQQMDYLGEDTPLPAPPESGGGKAVLFTAGRVVEGSWRKENADAPTLFVDMSGSPFCLTPGQTYIAQLPVGVASFTYR